MELRNKLSLPLWTLFLTLVCFVFTYVYYGFFYVEYEALFDSFYSGSLTEGMPFRSIYFLGNIGTSHFYSYLYEWFPSIEWISWILYTYLFFTCYLGLFIIGKISSTQFTFPFVAGIQILIYFLVFADQNIHFIFTRVSFMVSGISMIALFYFYKESGSIKARPIQFLFLNSWFFIGTLTRSESSTVIFLQTLFFGLFYLKNIKRLITLALFPSIILGSILTWIGYDLMTTKEFYKQVEPEIEAQFCERENMIPISKMKTYNDSVKYMAAKKIFWSDPKQITPSFMRSLINKEGLSYFNKNQWARVYKNLLAISLRFWHLELIGILLIISLIVFKTPQSKWEFFYTIGFALSFWILIAIQTYTVKVNDRSFSPVISIFLFSFVVAILANNSILTKNKTLVFFISNILGALFLIQLFYLKNESKQLKSNLEKYKSNINIIKSIAKRKILVVNSSSIDFLVSGNKPFHPFNFSQFEKVYITDGFNMPFLPYYRRYLEMQCHCNMEDFPSFWSYLLQNNEKVVIFSSFERIEILKSYLKIIHDFSIPIYEEKGINLEKNQKSDEKDYSTDLRIFKLGKYIQKNQKPGN